MPSRSALETIDPNADEHARKRVKTTHDYSLSTDPKNVAAREKRARERVQGASQTGVPKDAQDEMARMVAEQEDAYRGWASLVAARADLQSLLDFQMDRAQLKPLQLPACFQTERTVAFFRDLVHGLPNGTAPHELSGAIRVAGDEDHLGDLIRFYIRFLWSTVEQERRRSQRHVEGHMQDTAREKPFQMSIEGKDSSDRCFRDYRGVDGGDDGGPKRRHLQDWDAAQRAKERGKAGESTISNYYMETSFEEWAVYELVDLRIPLSPEEAALSASLRLRRSREAAINETVLIALLGPTSLNQSTGGERPLPWSPDATLACRQRAGKREASTATFSDFVVLLPVILANLDGTTSV